MIDQCDKSKEYFIIHDKVWYKKLMKASIKRIFFAQLFNIAINKQISQRNIIELTFSSQQVTSTQMQVVSTIKNAPSIHNIIQQEKQMKNNNQIKQFFRCRTFPIFPINDLKALPNYSTDQRFYLLVSQLEKWNRKVESCHVSNHSSAQLYRNKFIFTSLKSIVLNGTKGTLNYETNLNNLYQWLSKNTQQQMPIYLTTRNKSKQDEDWQVRKTYKSNMPLELQNYERRALFTTQQQLNYLHTQKPKQINQQKLINYIAIKQFKSKQLQHRQARQEDEIHHGKTLLKSKKSIFLQENCRNNQFFQGKFNYAYKTNTLFNRKKDKSTPNQNIRLKNSFSFSLLDREKDQIQKIKKYRFNSALGKKGVLFQERDPKINRTAKTFVTSKPFDATISDFGQTMMTTRKQMILTKQSSIKVDEDPGVRQQIFLKDRKQSGNGEFIQFMELKNWGGEGLISNPFEKKKQLKKKKIK